LLLMEGQTIAATQSENQSHGPLTALYFVL
jgi:hypothetical protein